LAILKVELDAISTTFIIVAKIIEGDT